jgi:muramoyltetrapeptide carboxypeptidase LdcA involved in peptidoglycan recycling
VIIRTLKYFSRIGLFSKAKAIVFGDFTCWPIGCDKTQQENNRQSILNILSSFANHHDLPVLYTTNFGHGKTNFPLVYSSQYRLQLGSHAQLTLLRESM